VAAAQLHDEPGGVPGRAAGEPTALQQHHVPSAQLGQMIGEAAPGDTAADDDDLGLRGEVFAHRALWSRIKLR
jgi:hypothetical protein